MENDKINFYKYKTPDGKSQIDVLLYDRSAWLTQKNIAALFNVKVNTINYHLKRLKIKDNSTIRKFGIVQNEGGRKIERRIDFYNFNVIMFVGYRVNSESADDFRAWMVSASRSYLVKGFAVDSDVNKESKKTLDSVKMNKVFFKTVWRKIKRFLGVCFMSSKKGYPH